MYHKKIVFIFVSSLSLLGMNQDNVRPLKIELSDGNEYETITTPFYVKDGFLDDGLIKSSIKQLPVIVQKEALYEVIDRVYPIKHRL